MKKLLSKILVNNLTNPVLYAITCEQAKTCDLLQKIEYLNNHGIKLFQVRQKQLDSQAFIALVNEIKNILDHDSVLIINDNLEVAVATNADGIHIGQDDLPISVCRAKLGFDKIIGMSVQTLDQALIAQEQGADYLGVGSMFATSTKNDAQLVSMETLQSIVMHVKIPVVVIGGITINNYKQFKMLKISGIAMVSTFFKNENYAQDVLTMQKEIKSW